ncbi:hypothetical protein CALVIDRAFT_543115 [Calocera viscosa TUFC12733]|uniref:Uncharacterized protein n=1 Tax=Calocera viscosa (strain TUFC12733) TaxID=1330018 RepID=A0A167FY77_CALVF|nr:hypothetical protein CALVIDRAFT_543115 [Calocera viscosa TUFC12733]
MAQPPPHPHIYPPALPPPLPTFLYSSAAPIQPRPALTPTSILHFLTDVPTSLIPTHQIVPTNSYESSYNALWPQHAPPLIVYNSNWLDFYLRDRMADWAARVPVNNAPWARAEPALRCGNEADVTDELKKDFLPRVRRALRAIIPNPKFYGYTGYPLHLHPVDFMVDRCQHGYLVRHWEDVVAGTNNPPVPDLLGFDVHGQDQNYPPNANRMPGEIKPSWKFGPGRDLTRDYMKNWMPLLQIHYYMLQRNARFGFILTDRELYCLCREHHPSPAHPDALPNGTLCVSPAITLSQSLAPNRAGPNAPAPMTPSDLFAALFPPNGQTQITAPLALFVLSVLASSDL